MTKWWEDLLNMAVSRKAKNWLETSFILLNTTKEDQEEFETKLKTLIGRVKEGNVEKKHNWLFFSSGPEKRKFMIVGYPYINIDKEERNNIMMNIINSEEVTKTRGVVIIGFDVNRFDYPYSVLAGRLETSLFDI